MEPRSDEILEATLRTLRPTPSPAFASGLDARVAAGFPVAASHPAPTALRRFMGRLRAVPPRRLLAPAAACALTGIVVATAVVAMSDSGRHAATGPVEEHLSGPAVESSDAAAAPAQSASGVSSGAQSSKPLPGAEVAPQSAPASKAYAGAAEPSSGPFAANTRHRDVVRDAQIMLGTDAAGLRDAAGKVLGVVHDYDGIVLRSSIRDGGDSASAGFDLLIPSAKLSDALADFSEIADVRSRHDSSSDVTAATIGLEERLRDAHAKVEGLLVQLAAASTDAERTVTEVELRAARRHVATLRARQTTLQRRVHLSRVSLRIETGPSAAAGSGSGRWGIGDAVHDAGRILAVAAGVALIGLAVIAPIALLCLIAWLAHRTWVRRSRERALD